MDKAKQKFEWLQSVRGLAALLVLLEHVLLYYSISIHTNNSLIDFFTIEVFDLGKIGIAIFFIISGFLIPNSYKKRTNRSFVLNRFFRLYPVYWFALVAGG